MAKLLREYESIIILRPDVDEAVQQTVRERVEGIISKYEGQVLEWDEWGRRKLAYTIRDRSAQKKHTKGTFHYFQFLGRADLVPELTRNFRLMEPVLKYMTIKVDVDVDPAARTASPPPAEA